jgi:hypothetical protein
MTRSPGSSPPPTGSPDGPPGPHHPDARTPRRLRTGEISLLRWRHVDLAAGQLRFTGKGDKPAVVTLPVQLAEQLLDWRAIVTDELGPLSVDVPVVCATRFPKGVYAQAAVPRLLAAPIGSDGLATIVHTRGVRMGIADLRPHDLRRIGTGHIGGRGHEHASDLVDGDSHAFDERAALADEIAAVVVRGAVGRLPAVVVGVGRAAGGVVVQLRHERVAHRRHCTSSDCYRVAHGSDELQRSSACFLTDEMEAVRDPAQLADNGCVDEHVGGEQVAGVGGLEWRNGGGASGRLDDRRQQDGEQQAEFAPFCLSLCQTKTVAADADSARRGHLVVSARCHMTTLTVRIHADHSRKPALLRTLVRFASVAIPDVPPRNASAPSAPR